MLRNDLKSLWQRPVIARAASILLVCAAPSWGASCAGPSAEVGNADASARINAWVRAQAEARAARARAQAEAGRQPEGPGGQAPAHEGSIPMRLTVEGEVPSAVGERGGVVVSTGVPFPPGALRDVARIAVRDRKGAEVPLHTEVLATWPRDGSIRSALVVFRVPLQAGERSLYYQIQYGKLRAQARAPQPALRPNPDGPVVATLPASWYARSMVSGPQVPALENRRFQGFEEKIERGLETMSPAFDGLGVKCDGSHRTYYDSPHALYQRFLRHGDPARFRRARAEAIWFRKNEVRFSADRAWAVHVCAPETWTPAEPLAWGVIRRMVAQGMLDDYLLTGDPATREAIVAVGEAMRRNVPAMRTPKEDHLTATERNMAFAMMILNGYYAVDPRPEVLAALRDLMDRTAAWQARGRHGAFEHDIARADPSECERGPRGASPFMTALLVDALMDYHDLTGDERVGGVVTRAASWLERHALTTDRRAFRYLWGCETDPYDDSYTTDLNLLVVPVFGAAYTFTKDERWLQVGDALADIGVDEMRVKTPKHWCQSMRGFGRYLGYRAALSASGKLAPAPSLERAPQQQTPQQQGPQQQTPQQQAPQQQAPQQQAPQQQAPAPTSQQAPATSPAPAIR